MKINLGHYQTADEELIIYGITKDTTPEEIKTLALNQGGMALETLHQQVYQNLKQVYKEHSKA